MSEERSKLIIDYLRLSRDLGASDLHLCAGAPAASRLNGAIVALEDKLLDADETRDLIYASLTEVQRARLQELALQQPACLLLACLSLLQAQAVLLRLAVLLHRSRSDEPLAVHAAAAGPRAITLEFAAGWLAGHPLTCSDLQQEAGILAQAGWQLSFV